MSSEYDSTILLRLMFLIAMSVSIQTLKCCREYMASKENLLRRLLSAIRALANNLAIFLQVKEVKVTTMKPLVPEVKVVTMKPLNIVHR